VEKKIKTMIDQINKRLAKLDFEALWTEFHYIRYALYTKTTVYFDNGDITSWNQRFMGNTAIEYNNRFLAIWNIEADEYKDADVFTSKLVHEMFHAFQREKQEIRWANEIKGLFYHYDLTNMALKHQENELLCQCLEAYEQQDWDDFISLRLYRNSQFAENVKYETQVEVIEGMAQYIEIKALKRLSITKGHKALQKIVESLKNPDNLFPIRRSCYNSGTVLCLVAELAGMTIRHVIGSETLTIFELLAKDGKYKVFVAEDENMAALVEKYDLYRKLTIEKAIAKATSIIEGDFELTGLDPMNTFVYKQWIHCHHFVMYQDQETAKIIQKPCVLVVNEQNTILKIYS